MQHAGQGSVVGAHNFELLEIAGFGAREFCIGDAVANQAFYFLACGLGDLVDIAGITDGCNREARSPVERRGRKAGIDPVGEPLLLANTISQTRREGVAAQNEVGHDEGRVVGVIVRERE